MDLNRTPAAPGPAADDLSALAWVHEELRKTLEKAHKGLRRYLREVEASAHSDLDDVEPTILRNARQHLHEGVGALQLVNVPEGALLLRASEAAVQRYVAKPQRLELKGVEAVEHASFALLDYLGRRLAGKPVQAVALFPQLRVLLELNAAERIHPADLWSHDWRWRAVQGPSVTPHVADAAVLADVERRMLALVKQNSPEAAAGLTRAFGAVALSAAPTSGQEATLWSIAAAFFEAWGRGLLAPDLFVKRTASRAMAALRARVRGDRDVSERLAQDLLFFCERAVPPDAATVPHLAGVRRAYQLASEKPVDYTEPRFGRHDPAVVIQARKRVVSAKEAWNGVAGGEPQRAASLIETFGLVGDSMRKLYPGGGQLAEALALAAEQTSRQPHPPAPQLAMEVATSLLYVEAALEEGDFDHPDQAARAQRLAQRMSRVSAGQPSEPLDPWMEELYRRVSDRQTMGSVVQELRSALSEIERQIDQFFRSPAESGLLVAVPDQLTAMRGVFSVLAIAPAMQAVARMRSDVEQLLHADADPRNPATQASFQRLAGNLGALGFLIDMLSVQPQMAKQLFRFDMLNGVLSPVMGRSDMAPDLIDRAQAIADAARRGDMPLEQVSAELTALSEEAEVSEQPALAATLSSAKEALEQASEAGAGRGTEGAAREHVAQAMDDFVATATSPMGLDPLGLPMFSRPMDLEAPPEEAPEFVPTGLEDDHEMRGVFLEESAEVLADAQAALAELSAAPSDLSAMTTTRRAFHTLKGSSRMVGFAAFGEAAWACEQLYNHALAAQAPASADLRTFTGDALGYFAAWVSAIGHGTESHFTPHPVMAAADALRLAGELMRVHLPGAAAPSTPPQSDYAPLSDLVDLEVSLDDLRAPVVETLQATQPVRLPVDWAYAGSDAPLEPAPVAATFPLSELDLVLDLDGEAPVLEPRLPAHETADEAVWAPTATAPADEDTFGESPPVEPVDAGVQPIAQDALFHEREPLPADGLTVSEPESLDVAAEAEAPYAFDAPFADEPGFDQPQPVETTAHVDLRPDQPETDSSWLAEPATQLDDGYTGMVPLDEPVHRAEEPTFAELADAPVLTDVIEPTLLLDVVPHAVFQPAAERPAEWVAEAPPSVAAELPHAETPELSDEQAAAYFTASEFGVTPAEGRPIDVEPAPSVDAGATDLAQPADDEAAASAELAFVRAEVIRLDDFRTAAAPPIEVGEVVEALDSMPGPDMFQSEPAPQARRDDESVKVVGPLRLQIPLFNIYLNEADELSRRLNNELALWSLELDRPVGETAGALAHSLAGSSATVGFTALSQIARELEHTLDRAQALGAGEPDDARLFIDVADEIRRLLHQFAAGFLQSPPAELHERLQAWQAAAVLRVPARPPETASGDSTLDQADAGPVTDFDGLPVSRADEVAEVPQPAVQAEADVAPALTDMPVLPEAIEVFELAESAIDTEPVFEVEPSAEPEPEPAVEAEPVFEFESAVEVDARAQVEVDFEAPAEVPAEVEFSFDLEAPAEASVTADEWPVETAGWPLLAPIVEADEVAVPPLVDVITYEAAQVDLPLDLSWTAAPPPAPMPEPVSLEDSDIDQLDQVDDELFPIFDEEAQELLPQLAGQVTEWQRAPADPGAPTACMRTLHTFKGSARLAGAMRLGELAHRFESAIERLIRSGPIGPAGWDELQRRVDSLRSAFDAVRSAHGAAPGSTLGLLTPNSVSGAWATRPVFLPESRGDFDRPSEPASLDAEDLIDTGFLLDQSPGTDSGHTASFASTLTTGGLPPASAPPSEAGDAPAPIDWSRFASDAVYPQTHVADRTPVSVQPVRVRAPLLDRLVNLAGEVSITRARLEAEVGSIRSSLVDLTENVERLNQQLRDVALQAESQLESRLQAAKAASQEFDPLELDRYTRLQELTRMMAESVNDVTTVRSTMQRTLQTAEDELAVQARLTRELQGDLLRTRMVEFESLSERLYRVVRQASKETGKQVRFDIVGGSIEVDRGVLDRMTAAFEHLLRNCVTHGIEGPEQRVAAAKDPTGSIVVSLQQEGNEVSVEIRDDGAGLDLLRIRDRAVAMGLIAADAQISDKDLANLIFAPGLSTMAVVTELAGRGVGMDVVRSDVHSMGGRVEIRTQTGRGTRFNLVLPLTTVVTQVVILRAGSRSIAVPSNLVELVQRATPGVIDQAYQQGRYSYGGLQLPFFWLGALLESSGRGVETGRTLPVVIVRSAQQRVALHVDEVQGSHEVVVKNLGPQLSRLPGLAGMTLMASGAVALIYNPVALASVYSQQALRLMQLASALPANSAMAPGHETVRPAPLVLVVDDSLTVRRVTKRLLEREGFRVALAKDGLEALDALSGERPVAVLSDIEMPRMDGFDLLRNIRGDANLASLPVIMITSRIAKKHRDIAIELGANHYLGKPYSEEELLGLLRKHVDALRRAAA